MGRPGVRAWLGLESCTGLNPLGHWWSTHLEKLSSKIGNGLRASCRWRMRRWMFDRSNRGSRTRKASAPCRGCCRLRFLLCRPSSVESNHSRQGAAAVSGPPCASNSDARAPQVVRKSRILKYDFFALDTERASSAPSLHVVRGFMHCSMHWSQSHIEKSTPDPPYRRGLVARFNLYLHHYDNIA